MPEAVSRGLEGVIVADNAMCYIDGQKGILRYRGIDIGEFARYSSYEETAYLVWFGELPIQSQLDEFKARLAAERELDESVWDMLTSFPCWPGGSPRPWRHCARRSRRYLPATPTLVMTAARPASTRPSI